MHIKFLQCVFAFGLLAAPAIAGAWDVPPADWDGNYNPPAGDGQAADPNKAATPTNTTPTAGEKKAIAEVHPGGTVVLPVTGIRVDLPALGSGATYRITGRWGLSDSDGSWSRDVIDESNGGNLIGATWYYVGPFKAGTCQQVLEKHGLSDGWRATTTLWGQNFEVAGGSFIFTNGNLGTRPAIILCGGSADRPMLLYRFFFDTGNPTALPKDTLLSRVATIPVLRLIAEGHVAGRWSRVRPLQAANVGTSDLLKYTRQAQLSQFSGTVSIPDDGAYWSVEKTDTSDYFSRLIPRFPLTSMHLLRGRSRQGCDAAFSATRESTRNKGHKLLPTLPAPSGWRAGLTYVESPKDTHTVLCRNVGSEVVLVEVHHDSGLGDLTETEPMLEAFVATIQASASQPTTPGTPVVTPNNPVTPSRPTPNPNPPSRSTYRDDWGGFGSVDLGVAVSYRDSKALGRSEELFPAVRVAGPGVSMGMTSFETEGGLILRYQLGLLPDFAGLFDDKPKSSSRWGAQVWDAAVDIGFGIAVGDDDILGLTIGWHGQSGPLLLNSSAAASFHWIHMPEDDEEFGWAMRVTPLQLIPSNERWLMSPLSVDLRLLSDGISFGLEFQWVGKPDPGDEDIPGEGVAAIIRLGFGSFFF